MQHTAALFGLAAALLLSACDSVLTADTAPAGVRGQHIGQLPYFRLPADFSAPAGNGKVYIWFQDDAQRRLFARPRQRENAHCHAFITDREDKILSRSQDSCAKLLQTHRIAH